VSAVLAGTIGFPHRAYARLLDEIAALEPAAIAPTAAGVRHAPPCAWLNRNVYPISETRFLGDVARRVAADVHPAPPGTVFELAAGQLARSDGSPLVTRGPAAVEPFVPFAIEPLTDPNPSGLEPDAMHARIERFVQEELAPSLARRVVGPIRLVLEVVYPHDRAAFTFVVGPPSRPGVAIERRFDADYDVLDAIAASYLVDVLEGRRHWGEPLLGGMLRASLRAYEVRSDGLVRTEVAPIFLYYALSYDESHERWIDHQLTR
jgi:hypothetical protein